MTAPDSAVIASEDDAVAAIQSALERVYEAYAAAGGRAPHYDERWRAREAYLDRLVGLHKWREFAVSLREYERWAIRLLERERR